MDLISNAMAWYPDRTVKPARIHKCTDCGRVVITLAEESPVAVDSFEGGKKSEHKHMVLTAQPYLRITSKGVTAVSDSPQRNEGHEGSLKEIPVIFRD